MARAAAFPDACAALFAPLHKPLFITMSQMRRRPALKAALSALAGALIPLRYTRAETYLTVEQAKRALWGTVMMSPLTVKLAREQAKAIGKASKTRVRNRDLKVWKTASGGWFILDQVVGKHEFIDMAVALDRQGKVRGIEVLTYRETYGHEIRNAAWRQQFHGRGPGRLLKLDRDIKNISGATLSCRHITDGINRLTETWHQVLRNR